MFEACYHIFEAAACQKNDCISNSKFIILRKVIQKNQLDATITIYWSPRSAQHVSGNPLPIFRRVRLRFFTAYGIVPCRCGSLGFGERQRGTTCTVWRKLLDWSWKSKNCYCCIQLFLLYYFTYIDDAQSNTNQVYKYITLFWQITTHFGLRVQHRAIIIKVVKIRCSAVQYKLNLWCGVTHDSQSLNKAI